MQQLIKRVFTMLPLVLLLIVVAMEINVSAMYASILGSPFTHSKKPDDEANHCNTTVPSKGEGSPIDDGQAVKAKT